MEFICVTLQNFYNLMEWNFILQGDEIQGMILIQDEGMDFQPSNIWIFIKFYGIIFPASKVWITGCVFQPEIK
jgi:hypothetical protein